MHTVRQDELLNDFVTYFFISKKAVFKMLTISGPSPEQALVLFAFVIDNYYV